MTSAQEDYWRTKEVNGSTNDPGPQMIPYWTANDPGPEMIPYWTANDPGPEIPPSMPFLIFFIIISSPESFPVRDHLWSWDHLRNRTDHQHGGSIFCATNISTSGQRIHLKLGEMSSLFIVSNITIS